MNTFNPSEPFEVVSEPKFDASKPFEIVPPSAEPLTSRTSLLSRADKLTTPTPINDAPTRAELDKSASDVAAEQKQRDTTPFTDAPKSPGEALATGYKEGGAKRLLDAVGAPLRYAGNVAKGFYNDVMEAVAQEAAGNRKTGLFENAGTEEQPRYPLQNTGAALMMQKPPSPTVTEEAQSLSGWRSIPPKAAETVAGMIPELVASGGLTKVMQAGGAPEAIAHMVSAGFIFGRGERGEFEPKQAALMALVSPVAKLGSSIAEKAVGKAAGGFASDNALNAVRTVGGFLATQAYFDGMSAKEYADPNLSEDDRWKLWGHNFAVNLGLHVPAMAGLALGHLDERQFEKAFGEGIKQSAADVANEASLPTSRLSRVEKLTGQPVAAAPVTPSPSVVPPATEAVAPKETADPTPPPAEDVTNPVTPVTNPVTPVETGSLNSKQVEDTPSASTIGTGSTGGTTVHPYEVAREAATPPVEEKQESIVDPAKYPVKRVDPRTLKLSAEVPNFKGNADMATGEVTPIEGEKYDYRDTGAVQVWVRLNGDKEIISGRHRWNQALRTGSEIPIQEHFESEGFTADHARILDAELNIRDGQGEVSDYANYFRNTKQLYTEAAARERGLLRGAKSRTGWYIGHDASDDLYALWSAGRINDAKAVAIASAAPDDINLQRFGIKSAEAGASAGQIVSRIESAKAHLASPQGKPTQPDFGDIIGGNNDWKALEEKFEREGDYVDEQRRAIQDIITTRSAILRRFDVATKSGSIKANAKRAQQELDRAHVDMERWENWALNPELKAQVEAATGGKIATTTAKESAPVETKLIPPTVDERKPDTGTTDMFGASVPAKSQEQLAEEKRLADQKAGIAEGHGKALTGHVDTSMDMFENGTGETPLLSQNPKLGASTSSPEGTERQGSIGGDSDAEGYNRVGATGPDKIRELIKKPEAGIPIFAQRVINAMLDTPVMRDLDWSRLALVISNRIDGDLQGAAVPLASLIEITRTADPETFPHEVFHFLFDMLPTQDRLSVDALRREAIKAFPREGLSPEALAVLDKLNRGETLETDDFASDLPNEMYPLINPSEYLADIASRKFVAGVWESRTQSVIGSLVDRVKGYVRGLLDSLKRVFGVKPGLEQIYRELLAGKHSEAMTDSGATYAKRRGSFAKDAEEARNAERLAQTREEREVEGQHLLAQSNDIVGALNKHGAGGIGAEAKDLLGLSDYEGIQASGRRLNGGIAQGYRQLKAAITDTYRRNWLARMAHQQFEILDRKLKSVIAERDTEADKLARPGFLKLLVREMAAKSKMDYADVTLRVSQSIFHSAITMAKKALTQEGKSDLEIATIEGELRALDDAEKSSVAMQQLLQDMVNVLGSTPDGLRALTDPAYGTRKQILSIYGDIKRATDPSANLHKSTLLNWAAYILHKSKDLRETLHASHLASLSPVRALMGPYEAQFMADFEKDPIKTIKREIRNQSKQATDAQKAAWAWRILHKQLTERLDHFATLDDAANVAAGVLADPDVKGLRSEIKDDAQVLGSIDPANPFTKNSVLLPDGSPVEIDPQKIVGSRTEFARVRAGFESAIAQLQGWLSNPANAGDVNYRMHERNMRDMQDYFAGLSMLQPNDPLRLFKRSFEIVRNAVSIAGGRVAAQTRVALARLDHDSRQTSWWTQRYTNLLAESAQRAIRSHGIKYSTYGDMSVHDANRLWYDRVGNQLFYSFNRQAGALKVGDTLASGEKVTQADMDHIRLTSEAITKGFGIVGDRQLTQDTLGGFTTFRKALKGNPLMTVRVFNDDLANFASEFMEKRAAWHEALSSGGSAAAEEAKLIGTLDTYFKRTAHAFTWDRNADFAKATAFDGPGGAFEVLADRMAQNPGRVNNMDDYFNELASLSTLSPDEAKKIILNEWGRIVESWSKEAVQDENADVPRAGETKNSFTRSRNEALAPYVFYENGLRNSHAVQSFGSGIQSRAMDDVVAGLDALIADIDRQQKAFRDEVARTAGTKADEKRIKTRKAIENANGDSFDRYEDLERRKKLVQDARDLMADKTNDTDVNVTAGRYIGMLTGILIGTAATVRNVTSGPRYLGQLARRLNASNLRSFPLAMWHGWLNVGARLMASAAYSVPKAALFDLPVGAGKAIKGLTVAQTRNVESFVHSLFRGVIKELGENIYMRVSEVKRMVDAGIHHIPDATAEWDNNLLGTWMTHGLILEKDLPTVDKLIQTPAALIETLILSFQKTLMPMFGDTGLNMATAMLMKGKGGPFQQLDHTLRRIYTDYKGSGYRAFDFTNPRSDMNVLSHKEVFPRGIREMRVSSSERDMQNLREQFESAGLNFDEKAAEFMAELDKGNIGAKFLNDAERDSMTNAAIDYTNRSSLTNNPLNLKKKNFVNNLVKPFMFWKVRTLSNFLGDLSTSVRTDERVKDSRDLFKQRAMQFAVASTMILLPMLFWGAMTNAGDEEANRKLKLALFNQITGFRQPWEREGAGSQSRGWLIHAFNGIPFIDMAMNTMFNDMPNRASFDPSLAAVEKAKDVARYVGGVIQTGDITYKLPQLISGLFPDTKVVLSRMQSQSGMREISNVAALATRHGPTELLRPSGSGNAGGVMANQLTPYADRMVNAATGGDMATFREVYEKAVQVARDMGRTDPEKVVAQMFRSRNPYSRALKAEMTTDQRTAFLASLSDSERARVESVESNLQRAGQTIGATMSFESSAGSGRGRSTTSPSLSSGGGASRSSVGVSRLSRAGSGRLPTARSAGRGRGARLARGSSGRRRGFSRLSRAPRLA
jgi:hypothetical protein